MTAPELMPCPVPDCGSRTDFYDESEFVTCLNLDCTYVAPTAEAHNALCRRAEVGRLVEEIGATGRDLTISPSSLGHPDVYVRARTKTETDSSEAASLLEALRSLAAEVAK